jgi:hypothetical protein
MVGSADDLIPELRKVHDRIAAAKQDAAQITTMLADDEAKRRPEPERWSIVECLDHLVVVGRKLIPRIDAGIEKARAKGWHGNGPFRYGRLESRFVRASGQRRHAHGRLFETPKASPSGREWPLEEVVRSFAHLQDDLLERVREANGIDLARVKITSPASRWVRLSLGQWFEFIARHQERHLREAREARRSVRPSPGSVKIDGC